MGDEEAGVAEVRQETLANLEAAGGARARVWSARVPERDRASLSSRPVGTEAEAEGRQIAGAVGVDRHSVAGAHSPGVEEEGLAEGATEDGADHVAEHGVAEKGPELLEWQERLELGVEGAALGLDVARDEPLEGERVGFLGESQGSGRLDQSAQDEKLPPCEALLAEAAIALGVPPSRSQQLGEAPWGRGPARSLLRLAPLGPAVDSGGVALLAELLGDGPLPEQGVFELGREGSLSVGLGFATLEISQEAGFLSAQGVEGVEEEVEEVESAFWARVAEHAGPQQSHL